jgi:pyruvate formate lyase activating enzyme
LKGLVFDIKRFALHDGPGIRTTVFLKGCPLRCWWCQNPESIREFPETAKVKSVPSSYNKFCEEDTTFGKEYSVESLIEELVKDRIFFEESGGGVTFSGGEPLVQYKFLSVLLNECKKVGLHTIIDTSGYAPIESFNEIYDLTDIFLFDIKLLDADLHKKFTDVSNELILENLKELTNRGNKVIIRIPLIPGVTDTEQNLSEIANYLSTLKNIHQIDLLPYNKISESKYQRLNQQALLGELETQSEDKLFNIRSMFTHLNSKISLRG